MAWKKWVGISLILLAGLWFALIFAVPFMPFSIPIKVALGVVFFVLMEVFFYVGAAVAGAQAVSHFWKKFKSKKKEEELRAKPPPKEP